MGLYIGLGCRRHAVREELSGQLFDVLGLTKLDGVVRTSKLDAEQKIINDPFREIARRSFLRSRSTSGPFQVNFLTALADYHPSLHMWLQEGSRFIHFDEQRQICIEVHFRSGSG